MRRFYCPALAWLSLALLLPFALPAQKGTVLVLDSLGLPARGLKVDYVPHKKSVPEPAGVTNEYGLIVVDFRLDSKGAMVLHWPGSSPHFLPLRERVSYPSFTEYDDVLLVDYTYDFSPEEYAQRLPYASVSGVEAQAPFAINKVEVNKAIAAEMRSLPAVKEPSVVEFKLFVKTDGKVAKRELIQSPGDDYTNLVATYIDKLRFTPAIVEGRPVDGWVHFPITFYPPE